ETGDDPDAIPPRTEWRGTGASFGGARYHGTFSSSLANLQLGVVRAGDHRGVACRKKTAGAKRVLHSPPDEHMEGPFQARSTAVWIWRSHRPVRPSPSSEERRDRRCHRTQVRRDENDANLGMHRLPMSQHCDGLALILRSSLS